jgi:hypothetical protein
VQGIIVGTSNNGLVLTKDYVKKDTLNLADSCEIVISSKNSSVSDLKVGDEVLAISGPDGKICRLDVKRHNFFGQFVENFCKNLFKPLLLFFYLGFIISVFKIHFDFPHSVYQGLTIYLLIAIGWHGGEELAVLSGATLNQALGFMLVGFLTNMVIGLLAYWLIRIFIPKMRRVDASVIAAYYGSDSAGTFVTCLGVLTAAHIAFAAYMPVMLAIMEIPGCLVGLYLVSRLRARRMDEEGNMPDEPGYVAKEVSEDDKQHSSMNLKALHEVFLNPGFFLLFGSIVIGFLSRMQGYRVVEANDKFFVSLFQGILCLFLLEMGMTAAKRLGDLKTASWKFIAFGIIAPNIFATVAILIACAFSHLTGQPFQLGTYVLFAVLCAAASYIAVPAIQRIAVPEASPTLPLAASLGLTFSYNVTIGIPLYMVIAECVVRTFPM